MNMVSTRTDPQGLRSPLARRALVVAAVVVLASLALPAAAAVYKWVDPQGHIHYSDRPPPPEGKLLSIDTSPQHTTHAADTSPRPATTPVTGPATGPISGPGANPEAVARLKEVVDNDVSTVRADQCKQAQEKYQKDVRSRRLYKEGPNKERIYLSDEELETERLQAKHDVDEFCGPGH